MKMIHVSMLDAITQRNSSWATAYENNTGNKQINHLPVEEAVAAA